MTYGPKFAAAFRALFHPRTLRQFAAEHRCASTGTDRQAACPCHALARVGWWEAARKTPKGELTAQSKRLAQQPPFPEPAADVAAPGGRMTRYELDDTTFDHLATWCDHNLRDEDQETVRDRILAYLDTCDTEEAAYSLSHGWSHIRDLVEAP